jgi:nicotinate-nucleotide pyrophosphorylase (carboxylating)
LDPKYIQKKLDEFLKEDMPLGDLTSFCTVNSATQTLAYFQAEDDLVFAGETVLIEMFKDENIELISHDGDFVKNGEIIARLKGNAQKILSLERVALNLIQRLSGIATLSREYTEIAKPYNVKILDTRKTTPGLRLFEKYAVAVGGAFNHRLDLSSGILIKDNHIKAAGGIKEAIIAVKSKLTNQLPIQIEVENNNEIIEALDAGVDGLLVDNFTPANLTTAVKMIRDYPNSSDVFIEASGGINFSNLSEYVKTGVDAISSGALTHSAKNANIHLEFEDEKD